MRCDFADSHLHGYFDGELSPPGIAEFERHAQDCVHCAVELVDLEFLRDRLHLAQLYTAAPASLRKKIRANLRSVPAVAAPPSPLWHWLAAAAFILLTLGALFRVLPLLHTDDYQLELAEEVVDAHIHSLQPGHLTGISSNDEQAVQEWFKGKLPFAVPVRDFAKGRFALQGGRLDVLEGRAVAVLVYARSRYLTNVFIWPTREPDTSQHAGSRQGYQWVEWKRGKMQFCVVSDASTSDLEQLQGLLTE